MKILKNKFIISLDQISAIREEYLKMAKKELSAMFKYRGKPSR